MVQLRIPIDNWNLLESDGIADAHWNVRLLQSSNDEINGVPRVEVARKRRVDTHWTSVIVDDAAVHYELVRFVEVGASWQRIWCSSLRDVNQSPVEGCCWGRRHQRSSEVLDLSHSLKVARRNDYDRLLRETRDQLSISWEGYSTLFDRVFVTWSTRVFTFVKFRHVKKRKRKKVMKITVIKKNTQLLKEVGGAKRKRSPGDDERRSFYNFQMEKIIYKKLITLSAGSRSVVLPGRRCY